MPMPWPMAMLMGMDHGGIGAMASPALLVFGDLD